MDLSSSPGLARASEALLLRPPGPDRPKPRTVASHPAQPRDGTGAANQLRIPSISAAVVAPGQALKRAGAAKEKGTRRRVSQSTGPSMHEERGRESERRERERNVRELLSDRQP